MTFSTHCPEAGAHKRLGIWMSLDIVAVRTQCRVTFGGRVVKQHPLFWFGANMRNGIFSHADVLELANGSLTSDTLQNWANRGLLKPDIVGGKRRYNTFELLKACISQPLVNDLKVSALMATGMTAQAFLLVVRNLVDTKKVKAQEGDIPLNQVEHFVVVFGKPGETPVIADGRKLSATLFSKPQAYGVLPFGRMLSDLASAAMEVAEARQREAGTERALEA